MKLALLGSDAEALELLELETLGGANELVAAYDFGEYGNALRELAPNIALDEDWEALLLGSRADFVVVGRGLAQLTDVTGIPDSERRAEQLRKLAQAGVPLLVFCPACEAIVGFEVEMIRCDVKGWIFPYFPGLPNLGELKTLVAQGAASPIGTIEQIVFERELGDRIRPVVLKQLSRDFHVLRQLLGGITKVTASGSPTPLGHDPLGPKRAELPSLANLTVHLQGNEGFGARWSISPLVNGEGARLTVVGTKGSAMLALPGRGYEQTLTILGTSKHSKNFDPEYYPWLFDHLRAQIDGKIAADEYAWLAASRDQEAAEAVDRSLARGRTIELFAEEHTEEDSFKGVMAMGGCLLLAMALGAVFVATIVEGLRLPMRNWPLWKLWPIYLLAPIVVFLLLQTLQLAIKREAPQRI